MINVEKRLKANKEGLKRESKEERTDTKKKGCTELKLDNQRGNKVWNTNIFPYSYFILPILIQTWKILK